MEWLMSAGSWLLANWNVLLEVVGFAAVLATLTPNTADDKIVQWVLDLVNFVGANVGKAKNSDVV